MTGNIWMCSHLLDEEDLDFGKHEFITYKMGQKQQYIRDAVNYIRNNVCSFEKRLSSSEFASELCGILQGHTEGSIKSIESNFGGIC